MWCHVFVLPLAGPSDWLAAPTGMSNLTGKFVDISKARNKTSSGGLVKTATKKEICNLNAIHF